MNRCFGWAMLVAAGMVLGAALGSYERPQAMAAPARQAAEDSDAELAEQLKEIKTQVKEINTLLHNGHVKVAVLMTPDAR